jgi:hypothetical protein
MALNGHTEETLTMNVVPGDVKGAIQYVPGRFGLAASLAPAKVEGKTSGGIAFPRDARTFCTERGTFSCWVKASSYHCQYLFAESGLHYALALWHYSPVKGQGLKYKSFLFFNNHPHRYNGLMGPDLLTDTWLHLCLTWDLKTQKVHYYVNGLKASHGFPKFDSKALKALTSESLLYIGSNGGPHGIYRGLIDDIVVLDKILTVFEVRALFFSGEFTPDSHTLLYIDFNQGTPNGVSIKK